MPPEDPVGFEQSHATPDQATPTSVLFDIRAGAIKSVILGGADHNGMFRTKRIPSARFAASDDPKIEFSEYMWVMDIEDAPQPTPEGFDGWWPDWNTGYGDVEAVADLTTLRQVPWLDRTAVVLCDYRYKDGRTYDLSPRDVLRGVADRYAAVDLEPRLAPELEFVIFDESERSAIDRGFRDLRPLAPKACPYGGLQASTDEKVIGPIVDSLVAFGIPIETWNPEGSPGQYELNIPHHSPVEAADLGFLLKQGVKELCALQGRTATFMAKLDQDEYGSSLHVHQSVWRGGETASYESSNSDGISAVFKSFIAGQLGTLGEFMPIWMPTPNSFKRLGNHTGGGSTVSWGGDNKSLSLRVLGKDGVSCRVEQRVPGADANVYLVLAAMLAGGLHGIEEELELPPSIDGDAYTDPGVERLPVDMSEALGRFEQSEVANTYLGESFVRRYAASRRREIEVARREVNEWELSRYFVRG